MRDPAHRTEEQVEGSAPPSPARTSRYTVEVLGPFGVARDGEALDTDAWQRRSQTLLKLLVMSPDRRRLRDEVIDLLWPEAEPEAGARNLRYVLHILRRDLGGGDPSPITFERGWLGLNPNYQWEIDLQRAEELAASVDADPETLEGIMSLYRGEPLAEDRYEDWAVAVRERAQRIWRTVGLRLARVYRERAALEDCARVAALLLAQDFLDEEALQELLQALEALDRRADGIRRFLEFEQRLQEEIGVPPSTETLALVERLKVQSGAAAATEGWPLDRATPERPPIGGFLGALPTGPIVAREEELERLAVAAEAVEAGSGRLLILGGETGVGKTRLAQEAMVRLRDMEFLVLTGRCYERERRVDFYPFIEPLAQACASPGTQRNEVKQRWPLLERLLSESPSDLVEEDRLQLHREASDLLASLSDERPLALLLDDLHWADDASLALLQHLARQMRGRPVLLLATYRDAEVDREHPLWQTLRDLDREGLLERAAVRRLTEDGTAALAATTIGDIAGAEDFVEFVHRRTKGNPFFIQKMLRALGGHYRLVRQIGAGGMGRVFEAVDTINGQRVAAKIMFARTEADPRALQRFEQEGAVLAALRHPNIVEVRGTFLEERASCIIMELLEGQSLGEMFRANRDQGDREGTHKGLPLRRIEEGSQREGTTPASGYPGLPLRRIKHLMRQVTAALACAHQRGIVHRDVKPDNIMVVGDDQVRVTDFGIARMLRPIEAVATMTSTGMTMGTPLYMAPEQIEGKRVDGRADIYSMGAVLYHAVTGRPPFEGDDALTVAISHVRDAPRPPRELNPDVPADWNALILKALAKDPADRFQSAATLEKALARLSDGAEVDRQTVSRRLAGYPVLVGALAVIAALIVVGIVAYSAFSTSSTGVTLGRMVASWTLPAPSSALLKSPAALAGDGRGGFYVLDRGTDRIQHLSSAGTVLGSWGGLGSNPGQLRDPRALAVDSAGNVYVADSGNDRVEKFSLGGRLLHSWGKSGSGLGEFRFPDGIAVDRLGFIYVSDWGNNRIDVLAPSGRPKVTNVGTFTALYSGLSHPKGVAVDAKGEVYVADNGDNQIVRYAPDGIIQLGSWTAAGDPSGITLDARDNVFVTDVRGSAVQSFTASGTLAGTWSEQGPGASSFKNPEGIMVDSQGRAYVADSGNARILKLTSANHRVAAWTTASPPQPPTPESIAVDTNGSVYVADTANSRILTLSSSGRWLGSQELGTINGPVQPGPLNPTTRYQGPIGGIAIDSKGNLLVTDYGSSRVLKFSPSGQFQGEWGSSGSGPRLVAPQGIAVDSKGAVYVVDQGNSRVQVFSPTGAFHTLARITGAGSSEPYLYGVALDRRGYVYLTDELADHVVRLSPQPRLSMVAQWGTRGSGSGELRAPQSVAVDSRTGILYVADTANNRIQLFSRAGKPLGSYSTPLARPAGVAVDRQGNVYVADTGNHRVEKFSR